MTNVLILCYSTHGHTEKMAYAAAEGARAVVGAEVAVKRVPELMPRDLRLKVGAKLDQSAPIAQPLELANYDAIQFGTPTRYGNMAAQMCNFFDQTGELCVAEGALISKVGGVFCSTASQHGGQETTLTSFHTTLLRLGMVIVGLPYSAAEQLRLDEITGGSPYGATTIAGSKATVSPAPTSFTSSASRRGTPRRSRPGSRAAESCPRRLAPGGRFSEGGMGGAAAPPSFFSGLSATIASVVTSRPATDAACCNAVRTTLVGSMMPALIMSLNPPVCAS